MWRRGLLFFFLGASVLTASAAHAQSLGEIARKEAARRGDVVAEGKVYTNGNIKPDPTTPAPEPSATEPVAVAAEEQEGAVLARSAGEAEPAVQDDNQPSSAPAPSGSQRGEAYWRDQAAQRRLKMAQADTQVQALTRRLAVVPPDTNEFTVTQGALKAAINDLDAANKEWRRFEELARLKQVPDAWIR